MHGGAATAACRLTAPELEIRPLAGADWLTQDGGGVGRGGKGGAGSGGVTALMYNSFIHLASPFSSHHSPPSPAQAVCPLFFCLGKCHLSERD